MQETMRVIRYYPPGSFDKLRYQSEPVPAPPSTGQAVIKVHGVGLIWPELTWPIYQSPSGEYVSHIPGHDFSGVITALGPDTATDLKVHDKVYGFTSRRNHEGAMAEFVKADIDQIVRAPREMDLLDAAAVPLSALTAWQALFVHGRLNASPGGAKGKKVLITGAAGGTGVWAAQFATRAGAEVWGTGSSDRSREIIEHHGTTFVDYKSVGLKEAVGEVDVVIDCVGSEVMSECLDVVKKDGRVVSIADVACEAKAKDKGVSGVFFIVSMNSDQLGQITELLDAGKLRAIVDAVYPLEKAREAFEAAAKGHIHGKVVIEVA